MLVDVALRRITLGFRAQHRVHNPSEALTRRLQIRHWNGKSHIVRREKSGLISSTWSKQNSQEEKDGTQPEGSPPEDATFGEVREEFRGLPLRIEVVKDSTVRASVEVQEVPATFQTTTDDTESAGSQNRFELQRHSVVSYEDTTDTSSSKAIADGTRSSFSVDSTPLSSFPQNVDDASETATLTPTSGESIDLDELEVILSQPVVNTQVVEPLSFWATHARLRDAEEGLLDIRQVIAGYHSHCYMHTNIYPVNERQYEIHPDLWAFERLLLHLFYRPLKRKISGKISSDLPTEANLERAICTLYLHSDAFRAIHRAHLHRRLDKDLQRLQGEKNNLLGQTIMFLPWPLSEADLPQLAWEVAVQQTSNTGSILRITSFTEALNTIRFGDAATLHIDSVLAGFWGHYCHNGGATEGDLANYLDILMYLFLKTLGPALPSFKLDRIIPILRTVFEQSHLEKTLHAHDILFGLRGTRFVRLFEFLFHGMVESQETAGAYLLFRMNRGRLCNTPYTDRDDLNPTINSKHPELSRRMVRRMLHDTGPIRVLRNYLEGPDADYEALHQAMRSIESHRKYVMYELLELCRKRQPIGENETTLRRFLRAWKRFLRWRQCRQQLESHYENSPQTDVKVVIPTQPSSFAGNAIPSAQGKANSLMRHLTANGDSSSSPFEFPSSQHTAKVSTKILEDHLDNSGAMRSPTSSVPLVSVQTLLQESTLDDPGLGASVRERLRSLPSVTEKMQGLDEVIRLLKSKAKRFGRRQRSISYRSAGQIRRSRIDCVLRMLHSNQRVLQELRLNLSEHQCGGIPERPTGSKAIELPHAIETIIAKDAPLLAQNHRRLQSLIKTLTVPQGREVVRRVLPTVKTCYLRFKRRGPWKSLQRTLLTIEVCQRLYKDAQTHRALPEQLLNMNASPNRFTGTCYATVTDELVALKRWRKDEERRNATLDEQYHQETVTGDAQSCTTSRRRLETSTLMLESVNKYVARISIGAKYNLGNTASPEVFDTMAEPPVSQDSRSCSEEMQMPHLNPLFLPNNVLHYLIEDVFDQFKIVMFRFGRDEFPETMMDKNWDCPETVPIKEFVDILLKHKDFYERIMFFKEEFESLLSIRNAIAHGRTNHDIDQIRALLTDICVAAETLGSQTFEAYIAPYQTLLQDYKQTVMSKRASLRQIATTRLRESNLKSKRLEDELNDNKAEVGEQLRKPEDHRAALQVQSHREISLLQRESILKERDLFIEASEPLRELVIRSRMRRLMNFASPEKRKHILQPLWSEHTSDQDGNNLAEAYTKDGKATDANLGSCESSYQAASTSLLRDHSFADSRPRSRKDAELDMAIDSDDYAEAMVFAARPGGISYANAHLITGSQSQHLGSAADECFQNPSYEFLQDDDEQNSNLADDIFDPGAAQSDRGQGQKGPIVSKYQRNTVAPRKSEQPIFPKPLKPSKRIDAANEGAKPQSHLLETKRFRRGQTFHSRRDPDYTSHSPSQDKSASPAKRKLPTDAFGILKMLSQPSKIQMYSGLETPAQGETGGASSPKRKSASPAEFKLSASAFTSASRILKVLSEKPRSQLYSNSATCAQDETGGASESETHKAGATPSSSEHHIPERKRRRTYERASIYERAMRSLRH